MVKCERHSFELEDDGFCFICHMRGTATQNLGLPDNYTGVHTDSVGTVRYFRQGRLHRVGAPAVVYANGDFAYALEGESHNLEGPADTSLNLGFETYALYGWVFDTKEDWESAVVEHKEAGSKSAKARDCPLCGAPTDTDFGDYGHSRLMFPMVFCTVCDAVRDIEVENVGEIEALNTAIHVWNKYLPVKDE